MDNFSSYLFRLFLTHTIVCILFRFQNNSIFQNLLFFFVHIKIDFNLFYKFRETIHVRSSKYSGRIPNTLTMAQIQQCWLNFILFDLFLARSMKVWVMSSACDVRIIPNCQFVSIDCLFFSLCMWFSLCLYSFYCMNDLSMCKYILLER